MPLRLQTLLTEQHLAQHHNRHIDASIREAFNSRQSHQRVSTSDFALLLEKRIKYPAVNGRQATEWVPEVHVVTVRWKFFRAVRPL